MEGCPVYCSVHREDGHNERKYDFRPPTKSERASTIETIFGVIKSVLGFRAFSLRGKEKVTGEWELACLSYNIKRLHSLAQGMTA